MHSDVALNLLLAHDSIEEANRLVSLLRNANYKVESKHAEREDVLSKLLQDKQWDLIVTQFSGQQIPVKSVFHQIRRRNLDTPVIIITEDHNPVETLEGLRHGATDVIAMDEDQHFLLAVTRTLYNLNQRRKLRQWKRRYFESEERADRLLQSSQDAIAIIQEGMYLYANDSYAQLFDHIDGDSMACLPVIDTIAEEEQFRLKPYLVEIQGDDPWENQELVFTGLTNTGKQIQIECAISKVDYKGEPALEFLVSKEQLLHLEGSADAELATTMATISPQKTIEHISNAIRKVAQQHNNSILLYITVDRCMELQQEIGIKKMESVLVQLSQNLGKLTDRNHSLERFKEDSFIIIMPDSSPEHGIQFAKRLALTVSNQIINIEQETFSLTLSIGASSINESTTTADECINNCLNAIEQVRGSSGVEEYGNDAYLFEADLSPEYSGDKEIEALGKTLLEQKQFELFYQPIITLHGTPGEFYEVLLRPKADAIPKDLPKDFIGKLFKTEIAREIDRWVILTSVKVQAEKLKTHPATQLFVNLSAQTICDESFIPWLKVALKASGISPRQIVFQMREIDVGRHFDTAIEAINGLEKIQSRVALSHFGLSLDPMKRLSQITVSFVKFDSHLVEKARSSEDGMEEIEKLVNELKAEDQNIIVPFVESAQMIPDLWQCGVHYIQGYFLQSPSPLMDFDFSNGE